MKPKRQYADPFVARNDAVQAIISRMVGELASGEHGITSVGPCGCAVLELDDSADQFEKRFLALSQGEPRLEACVAAIQDLRFWHFHAIEAFLLPMTTGFVAPPKVQEVASAIRTQRLRLDRTMNFPQPEETMYPSGVLRIWDVFIWVNTWPWNVVETEVNGMIQGLLAAKAEASFPHNEFPFLNRAVALLALFRELVRPTEQGVPEVDLVRLVSEAFQWTTLPTTAPAVVVAASARPPTPAEPVLNAS